MRRRAVEDPTALDPLVSAYGLVSSVGELRASGLPRGFHVWKAHGGVPGAPRWDREMTGGGRAWRDPELARFVAIAEAAERYTGWDVLDERRVVASAASLDGACLEPWRYPRCSDAEYARPGCPAAPFDPAAEIRWASGTDLISGEPVWVPAVMACFGLAEPSPSERFSPRISTGFAVHTDPVRAVVGGMLEVLERDAVAVLWLQRLRLPRVAAADLGVRAAELAEWCRLRFMDVHFFDATTDLGVPTVYCLICSEHDRRASRVVGASADRDMASAAEKALLEALGAPMFIHHVGEDAVPRDFADMRAAGDTARYMGLADRSEAFDFLLDEGARGPSVVRAPLDDDPATALRDLVGRLADAGMRPVVVDRTTSELAEVGLTAVNVVVADLQPMSLHPLAQFTAHPRLYEAPARMGHPACGIEELNPWPQPLG
ncbi:YcaO-like family protein [Streptomyces sp. SID9124]|uniref:YcaO-like family protein n=1 Tax=Streptomyces sp. SID9124 TaxID=2706108 RepID=UPI001EF18490|nr:YcaO-like family protein [Streptomyces sp. SID9124]